MEKVLVVVFTILAFIGIGLLMAFPVQFLWNDTISDIFGSKTITFFQAFELIILCGILFKNPHLNLNKK